MLELIAQGATIDQRWRRQLPIDQEIELGRATDAYRVPWDTQVSRRHVLIQPSEHYVTVRRCENTANPVFFDGEEATEFVLQPGQHFVIGSTTFLLTADQAIGSMAAPHPFSQRTFSSDFLEQVKYQDADRRIEVLNRMPQVIANANDSNELLTGMVNTLMAGIVTATTVGIVRSQTASGPASLPQAATRLEVIHWDRRGLERGDFQPSEKLVLQSVTDGESILNVWHPDFSTPSDNYTFDYENDWAFVCPIESPATSGWAIYVAGRNRKRDQGGSTAKESSSFKGGIDELDLDGDIKFCELVGSTLKNLLQVQQLEREQASLRNFFSPVVVEAIRSRSAEEVLAPRECEVTVLFCDLRGFAKTSEAMSDDLMGLLERVSDSLGITTRTVLKRSGVIGDFHGDAVMGFWGWPLECDTASNARSAISAALEIQELFAHQFKNHPTLHNFQVGMGLSSGIAVAGKIGTQDQVKVTAFGPVVNLASRLEGMTRRLNSQILADEATIDQLEISNSSTSDWFCRRLGTFQPFGLPRTVDVFQVLSAKEVTLSAIDCYHDAVAEFTAGNWDAARSTLERLSEDDSARQFLTQLMQEKTQPPAEFDGVIRMSSK
ncbi:MAG: adenylate/guanylate cyclase domain-containing protein [Planctomycetota bacterium]